VCVGGGGGAGSSCVSEVHTVKTFGNYLTSETLPYYTPVVSGEIHTVAFILPVKDSRVTWIGGDYVSE
jgi:hypothetical protein